MENTGGRFVVSDALQRSRRSRPETCPRRCRPLDPGLAISKANRSTERRAAVTRIGDDALQTHDVHLRIAPSRHKVSSAPWQLRRHDPSAGCSNERRGALASLSGLPVLPAYIRFRHGFARSTLSLNRTIKAACAIDPVRLSASVSASEICRVLRTRVSDPNCCHSSEREKARPPERSGCWLRRRLWDPRG